MTARRGWRAHVTARPSTLVLCALFVGVLVLYLLVRPTPASERDPQRVTVVPTVARTTAGATATTLR